MRKSIIILCMFLLCAPAAFADEVDQGLPKQTSEQLKANTREMIRLGAGSDDAVNMTRLMVQNRFQVENTIQAQEIVMNALKQGLPAEPVMNKAYEGMAKGVPAGSVVQAMEKTRARYAYAYEKAKGLEEDPDETPLTGEVIAEGMTAGLKNEDADRICDQLQTRDRLKDGEADMKQDRDRDRDRLHTLAQESFMTVREMARRGVPSDVAADAVCQALQNNYQAREMQQLRNAFMTNAAKGDPVQVANRYTYALRHGTSADDLETAGKYGNGSSGSGMSGGQGMDSGSETGGGSSGSDGSANGNGSGSSSGSDGSDSSGGSDSSSGGSSGSGSGGSGNGSGSGQGGRK